MNLAQIKKSIAWYEGEIDRLMSRGYAGSEDLSFKEACTNCREYEKRIEALKTIRNGIILKSKLTRSKNVRKGN